MSGSLLKILACLAMLLDHIAAFIPEEVPGIGEVLFCVGSKAVTLKYLMRAVGRMAFPIFAFLITEGFVHTRSRRNYGLNLLLFAIISEIPFNLASGGALLYHRQNVFFTLLLGYISLCCIERYKSGGEWRELFYVFVLFVVSIFLKADYGCFGYGFIILLYMLRSNKIIMSVVGACVLPSRWIAGLAFVPICFYNGKRGFATGLFSKYLFYIFYPLHLLVIYILK